MYIKTNRKLQVTVSCLLACLFSVYCIGGKAQRLEYNEKFNPVGSIVDASEKPLRDAVSLNGSWQFMPVYDVKEIGQFTKPQTFVWDRTAIKIPSAWNVNSFSSGDGGDFLAYPSYPKDWERATVGWMRKEFTLPAGWEGKRTVLHFDAIAGFAKIYVNGTLAGENLDIFFATRLDITSLLKEGSNEIVVGVAKASMTDVQGPYGRRNYVAGSFWGQHIAGIWQDVWLLSIPELSISDVFVQPDVANDYLNFSVTVKNETAKTQTFTLGAVVKKWEKPGPNDMFNGPLSNGGMTDDVLKVDRPGRISLKAGESVVVDLGRKTDGALALWTPDTPRLYGAVVTLSRGKETLDGKYARFGWRQFSISGQQLLLNGEPIVLKGDSWHFMGVAQMTRRYAWGWYKMLKDANANAVRLHAQPYPAFYMDVADEMGICVLPETGIWSSDGGPKMDSDDYWVYCQKHVKDMVLRDRNHPSVFGWSVCNETIPVVVNVFRAPKWVEDRQVAEINNWVRIVRENDPTRTWISGDGEDMRPTDLPTVIGHYGDEGSMRKWSSEGKPWGVGETGMGYYGNPRQISAVNGNRAYESQQGRMEGLAVEAYRLLKAQLDYGASYASVFNIAWYGLKPLEFGLRDVTRTPQPTDGVFFTEFEEGVPGMQPERLGPYTSTINPGYDPALPLYAPWPMFDAIKAVYAVPQRPYTIANTDYEAPAVPVATISRMGIVASTESPLREQWQELGVAFTETATGKEATAHPLLVVDGKHPLSDAASKQAMDASLAAGGTVVVWGVAPESMAVLNELLPYPLELTERTATSFIKKADDRFIGSLDNKDYYFSDLRRPVMQHGLSGEIVRGGKVILEACNTDWTRWSRGENVKTGSVIRSEREAKPTGAAVVKVAAGKGQIYLVSLDVAPLKSDGENLLRTTLSNLGLILMDVPLNTRRAFASDGMLERAIAFNQNTATETLLAMDNARFAATHESEESAFVQTGMQGTLNLERLPGVRREDTSVCISFWLYSPRSLVNLLVEPDMPKLDLIVDGATGVGAYINGSKADMEGKRLREMPLEEGWNHVVLRFEKTEARDWQARVRLESSSPAFFRMLKSSVAMP